MSEMQTAILIFAAVLCFGPGCVTAPPKKITAAEIAREQNAVGAELAHQFESKLHYRYDPEVEHYLTNLAQALAKPTSDSRLTDASVIVIQDRGGQWRSYSLPGRKTYLSLGLLQELHYDNEVAALIALEFGGIIQSHAMNRLKKQLSPATPAGTTVETMAPPTHVSQIVDFFGPEGIFSFDVDEMKGSIRQAIELMYHAGFDVRGVLQIWSVLRANPQHSPFPEKVLDEFEDYTRATISMYAPLRNPIVRTEEFESVHKRIMEL